MVTCAATPTMAKSPTLRSNLVRSAAASGWGRDTDFCQDLIRTQRGGEEIGKELGDWIVRSPLRPVANLSSEGEEGAG